MTNIDYKYDYKFYANPHVIATDLVQKIHEIAKQYMPDFIDLFPFIHGYHAIGVAKEELFYIQLKNVPTIIPQTFYISDENTINKYLEFVRMKTFTTNCDIINFSGKESISYNVFTYIGKRFEYNLSLQHILHNIYEWLNNFVFEEIKERNKRRIVDILPIPATFDVKGIFDNIYVIEVPGELQGTAFHLKNYGIITCCHCIWNEEEDRPFENIIMFRSENMNIKCNLKLIKYEKDIDLALLHADNFTLNSGLEYETSEKSKILDNIGIAAFPNHNFGDTGVFYPGLISGFRNHVGISHMLVNIPLTSGCSGSPAINSNNCVVGVSVTGADIIYNSKDTEKHCLIPIDAIKFLKEYKNKYE